MDRPSFLTGSRVYGTPSDQSDLDLVIRVSPEDMETLKKASDNGRLPIRFGKLNLICCVDEAHYDAFAEARRECLMASPVTRDEAVEIHKTQLREYGITPTEDLPKAKHLHQ